MASLAVRTPITAPSLRELRVRERGNPFLVLVGIIVLIAFLAALYLTALGRGTATAYRINDLDQEAKRLERENSALRLQVSQAQSLDHVQKEATSRLGMIPVDPKQVQYIQVPAAVVTPGLPAPQGTRASP
jgi:cell division protein FtsB